MQYSFLSLTFFFFVYAFLGWCLEALVYGVRRRGFVDPGFLSLPLILNYGATMTVLVVVLPSFGDSLIAQLIYTLIVSAVIERLSHFLSHRIAKNVVWPDRKGLFHASLKGIGISLIFALVFLTAYRIVHPAILALSELLPYLAVLILDCALIVLTLADIIGMAVASRRGAYAARREASGSARLADRMVASMWRRLEKTYPGIRDMDRAQADEHYTFASGMSPDKVIWVFFSTALLGDLIETCYCGLVNGEWMNRSSVLYGPFSFVWGIGAVLLTVALVPLSKKNDRWVFMGGFVIGGAFEYLCSVFTELVFGTVFWDYSYMPLNIGGRTNVLFCFFWGALSLVWIKLLYPNLSRAIEKLPALAGKLITWVLLVAMALNAALTMAAMIRFNTRREHPDPRSGYEAFLDAHFPDSVIAEHWPNMIIVDDKPTEPAPASEAA